MTTRINSEQAIKIFLLLQLAAKETAPTYEDLELYLKVKKMLPEEYKEAATSYELLVPTPFILEPKFAWDEYSMLIQITDLKSGSWEIISIYDNKEGADISLGYDFIDKRSHLVYNTTAGCIVYETVQKLVNQKIQQNREEFFEQEFITCYKNSIQKVAGCFPDSKFYYHPTTDWFRFEHSPEDKKVLFREYDINNFFACRGCDSGCLEYQEREPFFLRMLKKHFNIDAEIGVIKDDRYSAIMVHFYPEKNKYQDPNTTYTDPKLLAKKGS